MAESMIAREGAVSSAYFQTILLIERLHRQFLEVIKAELDRRQIKDINNVQALILYNIGDEEVTVGELTHRGYYLGSNVSYNVKKMTECGYLAQARSPHDRRAVHVSLSDKGRELRDVLSAMFETHLAALADRPEMEGRLEDANEALRWMERFWRELLHYGPSMAPKMATATG